MIIKNKVSSINSKTLIYLISFSAGLLLMVWLVQIIFFKVFYEKYQQNGLQMLATDIYNSDNVLDKLESITFDNNTCMQYIDSNGIVHFYNNRVTSCALGKAGVLDKYLFDMNNSSEAINSIELTNPVNKRNSLLYSIKTNSGIVYLFTILYFLTQKKELKAPFLLHKQKS